MWVLKHRSAQVPVAAGLLTEGPRRPPPPWGPTAPQDQDRGQSVASLVHSPPGWSISLLIPTCTR